MSNNNRDTLHQWLTEQLETVEGDGEQLAVIGLKIIAGGDEKTIYEMKAGQPKWGDAAAMADLLFMQASRTAKGLPGFCQFQAEAVYGKLGAAPSRFLPFGVMGATQLGPSVGGTAFGGLATEAPTPFGQASQGMRLTEQLVQGAFRMVEHVTNVMQRELERKDIRIDKMEHRLDEQWLALKQALLEIQNSAVSNTMKALQAEAVKKLITLAPGLVNMMTGRDVFPPSAVDSSLIEAMAANLTPEEQGGIIAWLNTNPNGAPVAAVITDQLSRHKKRKAAEAAELAQHSTGLPNRPYDEALTDAGGGVMRVLRGEPFKPGTPDPKELGAAAPTATTTAKIIADAETIEPEPAGTAAPEDDPKILLDGVLTSAGDNLGMMLTMMRTNGHKALADKLEAYHAKVQAAKG